VLTIVVIESSPFRSSSCAVSQSLNVWVVAKYPSMCICMESIRKGFNTPNRWPVSLNELSDLDRRCKKKNRINERELVSDPKSEPTLWRKRLESTSWRILVKVKLFQFINDSIFLSRRKSSSTRCGNMPVSPYLHKCDAALVKDSTESRYGIASKLKAFCDLQSKYELSPNAKTVIQNCRR
jgi:hypothetical protein